MSAVLAVRSSRQTSDAGGIKAPQRIVQEKGLLLTGRRHDF
jgi:hypothetical protein